MEILYWNSHKQQHMHASGKTAKRSRYSNRAVTMLWITLIQQSSWRYTRKNLQEEKKNRWKKKQNRFSPIHGINESISPNDAFCSLTIDDFTLDSYCNWLLSIIRNLLSSTLIEQSSRLEFLEMWYLLLLKWNTSSTMQSPNRQSNWSWL